ncbi:hypothetical protein LCGC14_2974210, partial [marine sediment metagenome]
SPYGDDAHTRHIVAHPFVWGR